MGEFHGRKTAAVSSYRRESLMRFLLSVVIAFAFLTICSKNSFLYPMNDWVDVNCFFTVGRSLLDGKVLYLDIYEQKGILVYAVYALAALISRTGFISVFFIELLPFAAFLYYGCRCVLLYHPRLSLWASAVVMAVLAFCVTTSIAFTHGGSVEEASLFMLTSSLFMVLRAVRASTPIKNLYAFVIGTFAGIALWSKFTILSFYMGLCLGVLFYYMRHRRWKHLMKNALWFLAGSAFVTVPILVYFFYKGALDAMAEAYFKNNILLYPSRMEYNRWTLFLSPIFNILVGIGQSIPLNGLSSVFLILGGWNLWKHRKTQPDAFFIAAAGFVLLVAGTFLGGKTFAVYYALILSSFAPFGLAAAFKVWPKYKERFLKGSFKIAPVLLMLVLAFLFSGNTYLMRYQKQDMPQYKFAKIIRQKEQASLLNYGFLDGGFYLAAGITPGNKYFCSLNIDLDAMDAEQRRIIEERQVDFVVTRDLRLEDGDLDATGYRMADVATFPFEGVERTYRLYARTENAKEPTTVLKKE